MRSCSGVLPTILAVLLCADFGLAEPVALDAQHVPGEKDGLKATSPQTTAPKRVARFVLLLARDRFNRGVLQGDAEQLRRALDVLQLGQAIDPAPALVFNAARVARELGHCELATNLYNEFLLHEKDDLRRSRAEQQLRDLGPCDPEQLGESSELLPGLGHPIVPAGPTDLALGRPIQWEELNEAVRSPAGRSEVGPWVWGIAGSAGLCLAAGGVLFMRAVNIDSALEQEANLSRIERLQRKGSELLTTSHVLLGVGAALGTAAVGVWVMGGPDTEESMAIQLGAGATGAHLALRGTF